MMSFRTGSSWCLAAMLMLPACARHKNLIDEEEQIVPISGPIVLEVENHNWSDVVLFIIQNGRTNRLAQIAAAKDGTFEIPPRYLAENASFQLGLHRIGGRDDFRTEVVSVRTGNTVRLTIEGKLEHSSIGVW